MTQSEIVIKRRENIIDEIVQDFGCYTDRSRRFNDALSKLSRNVFYLARNKRKDAEKNDALMIGVQIRDVKILRDLCDDYLKRLARNLEAFKTAGSDAPVPTWEEFLYGAEVIERIRNSAETRA